MGMGPFSSDSKTRTDSSVVNLGASDQASAVYARGKGATALGPGAQYIRIGKGGTIEYTVQATQTGSQPGAASYLAGAIDGQAAGTPVGPTGGDVSAPGGLFDKKTALLAAVIASILFVLLFLSRRA